MQAHPFSCSFGRSITRLREPQVHFCARKSYHKHMGWLLFIAFVLWLIIPWRTIMRRQQEERARRIDALAGQLCRAVEKLEIRVDYFLDPDEVGSSKPSSLERECASPR